MTYFVYHYSLIIVYTKWHSQLIDKDNEISGNLLSHLTKELEISQKILLSYCHKSIIRDGIDMFCLLY